MIPIHGFQDDGQQELRVVKLDSLTHYDTSEMHRHSYFELFVFEKGDGVHDIDFETFPIKSNSIHIVAPGQVHLVKRELDTNGFVILFETSIFENNSLILNFLYDRICHGVTEMSPSFSFTEEIQEQVLEITYNMWVDFNSDNELKNDFILNNLSILCIHCIRAMEDVQPILSKNQDIYGNFRRLLFNKFRNIKQVKGYARELNISEKQLNDVVSKRTGFSCSALIYRQIILEAKRLLNGGLSAKEVAYDLNFEDPAHFSKFFKKQTTISPSDFQKRQA